MENSKKVPSAPVAVLDEKSEKKQTIPETNQDEYNINVISDYDGKVDLLHLPNPDPKYAYRYLRVDEKNMSIKTGNLLLKKGGWQVVGKDHLLRIGIDETLIAPDGAYRLGKDLILAFMPRELYEKKQEYKQKEANEPIDYYRKVYEKGDSGRGLQTGKALGFKDED